MAKMKNSFLYVVEICGREKHAKVRTKWSKSQMDRNKSSLWKQNRLAFLNPQESFQMANTLTQKPFLKEKVNTILKSKYARVFYAILPIVATNTMVHPSTQYKTRFLVTSKWFSEVIVLSKLRIRLASSSFGVTIHVRCLLSPMYPRQERTRRERRGGRLLL